jgi:trehalose-6-phosphatase
MNKGTVVNYLIGYTLGKLGLDSSEVLPIYFGDDITDEDAFEARFYQKIIQKLNLISL